MLRKFHVYCSIDSDSLCLLKLTLLIQFTPSFGTVNLVLHIVAVISFIFFILLHNLHKLRLFYNVKVYRMLENRGCFNIIWTEAGIVIFIDSTQIPCQTKLFWNIYILFSQDPCLWFYYLTLYLYSVTCNRIKLLPHYILVWICLSDIYLDCGKHGSPYLD